MEKKVYKFENITFEESDLYEFNFPSFKLIFDGNEWLAESKDPDDDSVYVIDTTLNDSIELFGYELKNDLFKKIQEKIK